MTHPPTVFVVDDDRQARKSVCALVRSMGLPAESFESAEGFLEAYAEDRAGCLVTDVRMLGMSGLELQEQLRQRGIYLPVIVLTAYARTPLTVRAIQAGAVTLLEKPCRDDELWDAIRSALAQDEAVRKVHQRRAAIRRRAARLTPSERRVLELIVDGLPNKIVARRLNVSVRTIENRRR